MHDYGINPLSGSLGSPECFFRNALGSLTATLAGPMVLLLTLFLWVCSRTEDLNLDTCLGRRGGNAFSRQRVLFQGLSLPLADRGFPSVTAHSHSRSEETLNSHVRTRQCWGVMGTHYIQRSCTLAAALAAGEAEG